MVTIANVSYNLWDLFTTPEGILGTLCVVVGLMLLVAGNKYG